MTISTHFHILYASPTISGGNTFSVKVQLRDQWDNILPNKTVYFVVLYPVSQGGWNEVRNGTTDRSGIVTFYFRAVSSSWTNSIYYRCEFHGGTFCGQYYSPCSTGQIHATITWAVPATPTNVNTRISLTPTSMVSHAGEYLELSAKIEYDATAFGTVAWKPLHGAALYMYQSKDGGAWTLVGERTSDSNGEASWKFLEPHAPTTGSSVFTYRVGYANKAPYRWSESNWVRNKMYWQDTTKTSISTSTNTSQVTEGKQFTINVACSYGHGGTVDKGRVRLFWADASTGPSAALASNLSYSPKSAPTTTYGGITYYNTLALSTKWKQIQTATTSEGKATFYVTEKSEGTSCYIVLLSATDHYFGSESNMLRISVFPSTTHGTLHPEMPDLTKELIWLVPVNITDTGYTVQSMGTDYSNAVFINTLDITWKHPLNWESFDIPGKTVPVRHFLGGGSRVVSFHAIQRWDTSTKNKELLRKWAKNGQPLQFNSSYHYESMLVVITDFTLTYLDDWRTCNYSEYDLELSEYDPVAINWESISTSAAATDCATTRAAGTYTTYKVNGVTVPTVWTKDPSGKCTASLANILKIQTAYVGSPWAAGRATRDWYARQRSGAPQLVNKFMNDIGVSWMACQRFEKEEIWLFQTHIHWFVNRIRNYALLDSTAAANSYWKLRAFFDGHKNTAGAYDRCIGVLVKYTSPMITAADYKEPYP